MAGRLYKNGEKSGKLRLFAWVKKLGQRHYAIEGFVDTTLCGKPLLGNNYARHIPEKDQEECVECKRILETEFEEVIEETNK